MSKKGKKRAPASGDVATNRRAYLSTAGTSVRDAAVNTNGSGAEVRTKKRPSGPLQRMLSPTFSDSHRKLVAAPPSTRRTFSSSSCGARGGRGMVRSGDPANCAASRPTCNAPVSDRRTQRRKIHASKHNPRTRSRYCDRYSRHDARLYRGTSPAKRTLDSSCGHSGDS